MDTVSKRQWGSLCTEALPELLGSKLVCSKAKFWHGQLSLHSHLDLQAPQCIEGGPLLSGHCSSSCWGMVCEACQSLPACAAQHINLQLALQSWLATELRHLSG